MFELRKLQRTLAGLTLLVGLAPAWGSSIAMGNELDALATARLSIVTEDLTDHVRLLADDSLEGREAGSRGGYAAGSYIVRAFQQHLEPALAGQQYFQLFGNRYRNILGILPGQDPELKDEFILVGAHYDHVGYGSQRNSNGPIGFIHNGADDNASGVAAILELIDAFGHAQLKPRRSILFALWDGEEKGLLGSKHWASHPSVALQSIRLAINLDMVGRLKGRSLQVLGTRSMPGLRRSVSLANFPDELSLTFPWKMEENSDHHSFFSRQVPVLMFHTGLHDDYHRPSDDVERLDFDGLQATTRLIFNTLVRLSDHEQMQPFREAAHYEGENRQREFEQPLASPAPRLGVTWKPVDPGDPPGLSLQRILPGSAADRAGLKPGDRIVTLNGHPLLSSSTLQQSAVAARELVLGIVREGQDAEQSTTVTLDGRPARLGISWRHSSAEPGSVIVVRVLRHSLADQAGIRVGDRIHLVDGNEFADSREFQQLVERMELPAAVRLERDGNIREVMLPTLPSELASRESSASLPTGS